MINVKVLIFAVCIFPTYMFSKTYTICGDCEHTSISETIHLAEAGDTLEVLAGHYQEGNIIIDKSLHLIGQDWPVIDGEGNSEILTVVADSVTIEGLQLQNVGTSYTEDRAAIRIRKAKGCIIANNRLYNSFFGIYLERVTDCLIQGNEIIGEAEQEMSSGNAIHLWYCHRIRIHDNHLGHHRDGIYLEFVDHSVLKGNLSENNLRYGLHFMFSDHNEYQHNIFKHNGAGVAVMFSKFIVMQNNQFLGNWGPAAYGLLLKEIYDSEIRGNVFKENTQALYGESATRILIAENDFIHNGWAMKILGSCMDDTIVNNNFISNTFDLSTNSSRNYNHYMANYWSNYAAYDLDKDGVGDIPHRPVRLYAYLVAKVPPSIILLRSLFIDLIGFAEKIIPVLTPASLEDAQPRMVPRPSIHLPK